MAATMIVKFSRGAIQNMLTEHLANEFVSLRDGSRTVVIDWSDLAFAEDVTIKLVPVQQKGSNHD